MHGGPILCIASISVLGLLCFWLDGHCAAASRTRRKKFSSAAVYPLISAVTPKLLSYFLWNYNFRHL